MTPDYLVLDDPAAEQAIYDQMRAYDESERLKYAQIGLMARTVWERLLWKYRMDPEDGFPCRSFARWIRICCPYAYSTVYAALRDVDALQDVPAADLAQIPQSNMRTMKQLSTAVRRDPDVLKAAKGKTDGLVAYVKDKHPDQHIMAEKSMRFPLNELQMQEVQVAIEKAMERGCSSPSEVLWMWAVNELQTDDSPLQSEPDQKWGHA